MLGCNGREWWQKASVKHILSAFGQLLVDSFITSEEGLMGIGETSTKDWRDENQIPNTDGIEEIRKVLK